MFEVTDQKLAKKSLLFRYLFYVISSVRTVSFSSWQNAGEPNPFVSRTYRNKQTKRQEIIDIFDELGNASGRHQP